MIVQRPFDQVLDVIPLDSKLKKNFHFRDTSARFSVDYAMTILLVVEGSRLTFDLRCLFNGVDLSLECAIGSSVHMHIQVWYALYTFKV